MRQAAGGDAEGSGGGTMRNTEASGSHTVEIGAGSGQSETQNPGLRAAEAKGAEAVRSPNHRHSHVKPASSRGVPSNDILQQQVTTDDGHLVLPRHHILQQAEFAKRWALLPRDQHERTPCAISNTSSTCFAASVLQCLRSTQLLSQCSSHTSEGTSGVPELDRQGPYTHSLLGHIRDAWASTVLPAPELVQRWRKEYKEGETAEEDPDEFLTQLLLAVRRESTEAGGTQVRRAATCHSPRVHLLPWG